MMKAWIDGQEKVDTELLKSCTKFLELRILRQDEVSAWCVKTIADLAPGLFLNSRFDTTSMILARHAKDEFIEKYQQEISHLLQQPQERYLTNDEGETALFSVFISKPLSLYSMSG